MRLARLPRDNALEFPGLSFSPNRSHVRFPVGLFSFQFLPIFRKIVRVFFGTGYSKHSFVRPGSCQHIRLRFEWLAFSRSLGTGDAFSFRAFRAFDPGSTRSQSSVLQRFSTFPDVLWKNSRAWTRHLVGTLGKDSFLTGWPLSVVDWIGVSVWHYCVIPLDGGSGRSNTISALRLGRPSNIRIILPII